MVVTIEKSNETEYANELTPSGEKLVDGANGAHTSQSESPAKGEVGKLEGDTRGASATLTSSITLLENEEATKSATMKAEHAADVAESSATGSSAEISTAGILDKPAELACAGEPAETTLPVTTSCTVEDTAASAAHSNSSGQFEAGGCLDVFPESCAKSVVPKNACSADLIQIDIMASSAQPQGACGSSVCADGEERVDSNRGCNNITAGFPLMPASIVERAGFDDDSTTAPPHSQSDGCFEEDSGVEPAWVDDLFHDISIRRDVVDNGNSAVLNGQKGAMRHFATETQMESVQASPEWSTRFFLWRKALLGDRKTSTSFSRWSGEFKQPNQRVIKADCERTRADMEFFKLPKTQSKLEAMLTCWCVQNQGDYKQGLNEVLAVFLFLQSDPVGQVPTDDEIFDCFCSFVRRYAPFFNSADFVPLQCAFVFFRHLLLYHRPDLAALLTDGEVVPDMYCMRWFLTVFASKTPLRLAQRLWDRHLEKGDPQFFIFLSAALVIDADQPLLQAERSCLPEVLSNLGPSTSSDLDRQWTLAETLYNSTPTTFAARVRRNVLRTRNSAQNAAEGRNDGEQECQSSLLQRLEKERVFFILPDEVVGRSYARRSGNFHMWQPTETSTWQFVVLDVRPEKEFQIAHLPAAIRFDTPGVRGSWETVLPWVTGAAASSLNARNAIETLKDLLGEEGVCDKDTHICICGSVSETLLVRTLYIILTEELALRHVSVASGGWEAVFATAQKHGNEIVSDIQVPVDKSSHAKPECEGSAGESGLELAQASRWGSTFVSAWSGFKKSAANAAEVVQTSAADVKKSAASAAEAVQTSAAEAVASAAASAASAAEIATAAAATAKDAVRSARTGPAADAGAAKIAYRMEEFADKYVRAPAIIDRPGNWVADVDFRQKCRNLSCAEEEEITSARCTWKCVAVYVRCSLATGLPLHQVPWKGCHCVLSVLKGRLLCASAHGLCAPADDAGASHEIPVCVLFEVNVTEISRVASKKNAPDVLILHLRRECAGTQDFLAEPAEPFGVLHFVGGIAASRSFLSHLRQWCSVVNA